MVMLVSILATILSTHAKIKENKPDSLVIALMQTGSDLQYVKPVQQWFLKIYTEALSRMGISLDYRVLPPKRASIYSDQGVLDGELSRVFDYNTEHTNLVRVEEHHLYSVFSAFAADPTITLNGWESLHSTNYKVDYRRGIKKCSEKLSAIVPPELLSETSSIQAGVRRLLTGRTDIYIEPEDGVFDYLKSDELQKIKKGDEPTIHKVGIMETVTSHFWLHKKHQDLVPRISGILRDMKEEGLFELYLEQFGLSPSALKW